MALQGGFVDFTSNLFNLKLFLNFFRRVRVFICPRFSGVERALELLTFQHSGVSFGGHDHLEIFALDGFSSLKSACVVVIFFLLFFVGLTYLFNSAHSHKLHNFEGDHILHYLLDPLPNTK